jgi:hypothetical protein
MGSRTLVVGDVHGCAAELRALVKKVKPTRLIMVGDLFTKGPDPVGVWRVLRSERAEGVLGNHDAYVLAHRDAGAWRDLPKTAWRWLEALPLTLKLPGAVIVHAGLHPEKGAAATNRRMATTMRRWPDDGKGEASTNPFWWDQYTGTRLVIYGHDARRGLVDRRPRTLGLDTGCVYGRSLSGYLLERDRLVSVPAGKAYRPV